EMHRMMVDTRKDFVSGLPRSMYHAVERLEKAGHIAPVETVRDGRAPERTVFAITELGQDVVRARIERLLRVPDTNSTLFTAALSFIVCLPTTRAAEALCVRREALRRQISEIETDLDRVPAELPRVLLIETEYERDSIRAQLSWVDQILDEITAGTLRWPDDVTSLTHDLGGGSAHVT